MQKHELDREFAAIYEAHVRDVYTFVYYRVFDHHDAEDLTEQTFHRAYRHLERALEESNGRPLRPWLIRIAQNLAANHSRDQARRRQEPLEEQDDSRGTLRSAFDTETQALERDELRDVLDAVAELEGERREALIMRFALGMDNREIARALGRSEGATRVLLHRAVRQIRNKIQRDEQEK